MKYSFLSLSALAVVLACAEDMQPTQPVTSSSPVFAKGGTSMSPKTLAEGREIFRFDTFGD
ncbi:MAG TPA: hypothetical protein VF042_03110, partial [Gemmatimonadaceae bacterium]